MGRASATATGKYVELILIDFDQAQDVQVGFSRLCLGRLIGMVRACLGVLFFGRDHGGAPVGNVLN